MTLIDMYAGEPHFIDHLAPVYLALPPEHRGRFVLFRSSMYKLTAQDLVARAASRGVVGATYSADKSHAVLVASFGDQSRAIKAGYRSIARMEHGIGQSFKGIDHCSYAGGKGAEKVGLFLTPNEQSAKRWRATYPNTPIEVIGCPKLDSLPARVPGKGPVVALSFHWGFTSMPRGPLSESHGSWHEYKNYIGKLTASYTVIGHGHPRMLYQMEPTYKVAGIPIVKDFADVCRQADLYVCDTNSTIYEFASTGRPVVVVNGKHFRRNVEHGLRFWEASTVGVNCDSPGQLPSAIDAALFDSSDQRKAREAALDIVYAYRTGAAQRAADALVAWITGKLTRAAA